MTILMYHHETKLQKATIAVIISAYNQGSFLGESIESVLRQTIMPDEILISDDASEDNTYEIANFYINKYPHVIKVNRNEENLGIVRNFNKAVSLTSSDYISILNADDRYRSDFFEKTSLILDQYSDVGIAYSDFALFGPRARVVYNSYPLDRRGLIKADKFFIINFPDFNEASKQKLLTQGNFIHGASLFRKQAFDEVGGYIYQATIPEDYYLFYRMVKQGWNARRVPYPILEYRQYSKAQTNTRLATFVELQYYKQLTKSLYQQIEQLNRRLQTIETTQAYVFINNNHSLAKEEEDIVNACNAIFQAAQQRSAIELGNNRLKSIEEQNTYQTNLLSIVVPWWDHTELLEIWKRNLEYLGDAEIIFVDNGSQTEGKLALQEFCSQYNIKLIRNEENRGFSAANNQGSEVATGEYILYLNNDVEILNFPAQFLCNLAANGISGPGLIQNELDEIYIEGWALCIKKSTLEALGGWCEDYGPGYWDDVDLCHRSRLAGYSLTPIPDIHRWMRHKQNTTGRDGRLDQIALHVRNRGIFIRRHYSLHPKIVVDAVFFQLYQTGIARVWKSLLEEWANNGFGKYIIVLDRAGTAPKIPGIRYRTVAAYDYSNTDADREMLQQVCDEEDADVFISSYYTTPITTPSVFMAHDMIPELFGWNLNHPMWQEKHYGIQHAAAYIAVSDNTARDLVKFFPDIALESVIVAKNGVDHTKFLVASQEHIILFRKKYGISKPYFILVGIGDGYKNSILFFQAFSQLASSYGFDIICTGSGGLLAPELRTYTSASSVHMLQLEDQELATAYSGAVALVYPSKYEGFGMPIAEAMACGCPVITCPNASLPEVAGKAAIYVKDDDVQGLADALCEVQKPSIRNGLINAGLEQAKKFSWSKMANTVSSVLIDATLLPLKLRDINLIIFPDWSQPEESLSLELERVIKAIASLPESEKITLLIDTSNIHSTEDAEIFLSYITMNLLMNEDLDITEGLEISLIGQLADIQWQALLPRLKARIVLEKENKEALAQVQLENLPFYDLDSYSQNSVITLT